MSDDLGGDPINSDEEVKVENAGTSLMDELSATREQLSEPKEPRDFPLPGYGDKLVARYRALDFEELEKIQERVSKIAQTGDKDAQLYGMADTLAEACVGFFTVVNGEKLPLGEATGLSELPVKYDRNLATALRFELNKDTAREVVLMTIPDRVTLIAHYAELGQWMTATNAAADETFLMGLPATPE